MPVSADNGKEFTRQMMAGIKHERMLDIGAGCGTYAKLFPEASWVGVEAWEPYVSEFDLPSLYDNLIVDDARTVDYERLGRFDVAVAGDVLEHMTSEEAADLVDRLKAVADYVFVSIPLGHCPQDAVNGNEYERHIEDWSDEKVRKVFGEPVASHIDWIIGVYVFSNKPVAIPKTLHVIWVGDESLRPDRFIDSWRHKNPSWSLKVWGNKELAETDWQNRALIDKYYSDGQYCGVADLMRYEILLNEGGFCVDADSECVAPLDDFLFHSDVVCAYENEHARGATVAVGNMGAKAGLPFFQKIIESIKADESAHERLPWLSTGPTVLTRAINKDRPESISIFPSYTFIPNHFAAPEYTGGGKVYAKQFWGSTNNSYGRIGMYRSKLKICVYSIAKNEEKFVGRWAESARGADLIFLADTGSTDGTISECAKHGVDVRRITIDPWRFDYARNVALAMIPDDIDVCISLDLDEVLSDGWREEIERSWAHDTTRIQHAFSFAPGLYYYNTRIHARRGYYWRHMCHEIVCPAPGVSERLVFNDRILISHKPDQTKSRSGYLDLLATAAKDDRACPRMAYYYARELSYRGLWAECIAEFERYLAMPTAVWNSERSFAMRTIAQGHEILGQRDRAEAFWLKAASETPSQREPWVGLAQLYYNQGRWDECLSSATRALAIKTRELVYTGDPAAWGVQPHDLAAIAAWNLGLMDIAVTQGELALQFCPDDPRLKENLLWFRGEKRAA